MERFNIKLHSVVGSKANPSKVAKNYLSVLVVNCLRKIIILRIWTQKRAFDLRGSYGAHFVILY